MNIFSIQDFLDLVYFTSNETFNNTTVIFVFS